MTETEIRQKVVAIPFQWLGAKKGSNIHHKIIDIYNSYTPLPRKVRMSYTMDWCAATTSAVGIVAGLTDIMPVECSCGELIRLYKALGCWVENDSHIPLPGDLVLYAWDDDGVGDCTKAPNHIGMVTSVIGDYITIIEGNMGSQSKVGTRKIKVNERYIRGYCCPDYASEVEDDMKLYKYVNELPYGKDSVTKAIQNGYIKLNKDGSMGLWEANIQTVILMDRTGMLDKPTVNDV